jgi:hypothetical protein
MMTPTPKATRQLLHRRDITIEGYRRCDGLWDVEGRLLDRRTETARWPGGERAGGEPIHSMTLCLTVDATGLIVDVDAQTAATPYTGFCPTITPRYKQLVGLRIGRGFRHQALRLLAGTQGCTHLTELLGALATGVIQTLAGERESDPDARPFQLEGCHVFARSSPVIAQHYPRWYLAPAEQGEE